MRRLVWVAALSTLLLVSLVPVSYAAPYCAEGQAPEFNFGFKALKDLLGDVMGDPTSCEYGDPNGSGDTLQDTSKGLSFYRLSTNTPTFTNGWEHWAITAQGVVYWTGNSIDPPGTATTTEPITPNTTAPPHSTRVVTRAPLYGVDEGHKNQLSKQLPIRWQRLTFPWPSIQPNGPHEWDADNAFQPEALQREMSGSAGPIQIAGLVQFTPPWAQSDQSHGERSVPRNLNLPWDHPENYWGQFTHRLAQHYAGRVDTWIIWNEPEIRFEDEGGGSSWTWAGGPEEYYQLLKVAYRNIKAANPNARVVFGGTAYWLDRNSEREQFFKRVLDIAARDPEAAANGFFFDVGSFNLYWAPADLYRVFFEMKELMAQYGLDKELWITETNSMPYDPEVPCADRYHPSVRPLGTNLQEQAYYAIQAAAMAAAAGWERLAWYQMTDDNTCIASAIWGLVRADGRPRPAFDAYKTATTYLSGADSVTFKPLERWEESWHPWPRHPLSIFPNWQIWQVVFQRGNQRVTALWNGDAEPTQAWIRHYGGAVRAVDWSGQTSDVNVANGWAGVTLGGATAHGPTDPAGYYFVGGPPVLIIEEGVDPGAAVEVPHTAQPGTVPADFRIAVAPQFLNADRGGAVTFTLRTQGVAGFDTPVNLRFKEYWTQRDPAHVPQLPSAIQASFPAIVGLGHTAEVVVQTTQNVQPGIHSLLIEASGDGITKDFEVVVLVE